MSMPVMLLSEEPYMSAHGGPSLVLVLSIIPLKGCIIILSVLCAKLGFIKITRAIAAMYTNENQLAFNIFVLENLSFFIVIPPLLLFYFFMLSKKCEEIMK